MTITRTGSNKKYAHGWAAAFGKKKKAKPDQAPRKKSRKKASRK